MSWLVCSAQKTRWAASRWPAFFCLSSLQNIDFLAYDARKLLLSLNKCRKKEAMPVWSARLLSRLQDALYPASFSVFPMSKKLSFQIHGFLSNFAPSKKWPRDLPHLFGPLCSQKSLWHTQMIVCSLFCPTSSKIHLLHLIQDQGVGNFVPSSTSSRLLWCLGGPFSSSKLTKTLNRTWSPSILSQKSLRSLYALLGSSPPSFKNRRVWYHVQLVCSVL